MRNFKGQFIKGNIPYTKNKKGIHLSSGTEFKKGHKFLGDLSKPNYFQKGYKHTDEWKKERSNAQKGDKSHFWRGGISFEPYGLEFNDELKEVIRNRDRRKCQICGKTELESGEKLHCHHIDYNKKNNNPNNLISLCRKCHLRTNHRRDYWIKYFKIQYDKYTS